MKSARWFFDYVSPFSYLVLKQMEEIRGQLDVMPVPVVLGALLGHWEQRGPAEIGPKRLHTYRMALWRAKQLGIPMRFPSAHPFNSLAALRLTVALGSSWDAIGAIFDAAWREGGDLQSPAEIERIGLELGLANPAEAIKDPQVKERLRRNGEGAVEAGVFGVPTLVVKDELFWGEDALPMLRASLENPSLFAEGEMARVANLPVGVVRRI